MSSCALASRVAPWSEADRLAALREFQILDSGPEAAFDDIARSAALICGVPTALIVLADENRLWCKAAFGWDGAREIPCEPVTGAQAILGPDLVVVPDAAQDARSRDNPLVAAAPLLRFYAGAPLVTDTGLPLGILCILDAEPRPDGLAAGQGEALRALARAVMSELRLRSRSIVETETRLRAAIDAIPQMVWSARPDGHGDYHNQRWYEFTGAPRDAAEGARWREIVHPEDRDRTRTLWRHSLATGDPFEIEYRVLHHSGEYRWCLGLARPVRDAGGAIERWFGTCTDVHEFRQARRALDEREEFTRRLLSSSEDCINVLGLDGRLCFMSDGGLRAMEVCDSGRIEGHHWPDLWTGQAAADAEAALEKARAGGSGRFEGFCPTLAGTPKWWDVVVTAVKGPDGRPERLLSISRDITVRKQAEDDLRASEQRLLLSLRAGRMAALQLDLRTNVIMRHQNTIDLLGVESSTLAEFMQQVHPEDRYKEQEFFHDIVTRGASALAFRYILPDGETRWIRLHAERSAPDHVFGVMFDITARMRTEADLAEKAALIEATLEAMEQGLIMVDAERRVKVFNRRALELLDLPSDFMGSGPTLPELKRYQSEHGDLGPADGTQPENLSVGDFLSDPLVYERTRPNGTVLEVRTVPLSNGGAVRTYMDITARREAEGKLRASEERLRLALQAGRMIAWEQDLRTNYITRSENAAELLGIGSGPLSDFIRLIHPHHRARRKRFAQHLLERGHGESEFIFVRPDGATLWLAGRGEMAGPDRVVGVTYDISGRKAAEEEIWRAANHDGLTGLPNRSLLNARLEQALEAAQETATPVCLVLIDLDDFKEVNDACGHDAGDALLKETAARLTALARPSDTVARLGGDEFAVLLAGSRLDQAVPLAENIVKRLSHPFSYAGQALSSRASVGLAGFPDHHAEPAELMKDADIALYRAKAAGGNAIMVYEPEMRAATEQRLVLRRDMREALARGQIVPYYQPKVCLATGTIVGFEALARWQHPTGGLLNPGTFGAAFDDPELATAVGKRLIGRVASDMRGWLKGGLRFGRVAINLSHAEFIQAGLADDILRVLDLAKVPAEHFEVEITEKVLLDVRSDAVLSALETFRRRGVRIALDDFGTGYASLTHLKQFPVDHIKIDQSFVRDIEQDPDDAAIVAAVVGLGKSLDLQVTAEGVETLGQAARLRQMGCGHAQGHLYARPVSGPEVPEFVARWTTRLVPPKTASGAQR